MLVFMHRTSSLTRFLRSRSATSLKSCWLHPEPTSDHLAAATTASLHRQVSLWAASLASQSAGSRLEGYKNSLSQAGLDAAVTTMDPSILWPPECVRGMKVLDIAAFSKTITVPVAKVNVAHISPVLKVLTAYFLKLRKFSAIDEGDDSNYKVVYLNPLLYAEHEEKIKLQVSDLSQRLTDGKSELVEFSSRSLELIYDNWSANETLQSILPLEENGVAGFSKVGHLIHLNLKEVVEPYKFIIGKVLLDKSANDITMIVNKVDPIDKSDNTFRTFSMEVLAGEGDTVTTAKQNRCSFTFDFAKVYWNSRLSTEHDVIIRKLCRWDVLYDVMAGVGPFSIPAAASKKCQVFANDLNPESYRWLVHNCTINKVDSMVTCSNLDGSEFIKQVIKKDLLQRWKDPDFQGTMHITMNLPSIAVEFLPSFVGLMSHVDDSDTDLNYVEPLVHVYMFSKDQKASSCCTRVAYYLGLVDALPDFDGEVAAALVALHKCDDQDHKTENGSSVDRKGDSNNGVQANTPKTIKEIHTGRKLINDSVEIPGLVIEEVTLVRKVAPLKAMVRVCVRLTKELLVKKTTLCRNTDAQTSRTTATAVKQSSDDDHQNIGSHCKKLKLDTSES